MSSAVWEASLSLLSATPSLMRICPSSSKGMDSTDVPSKQQQPAGTATPVPIGPLPPAEARATVRANEEQIPFPDRNTTTTLLISIFLGLIGLDHFFLRSPKTGVFKALTLGGFGVWWIWDVIQLFAEPTRASLFGLSAPFDFVTGIGQGQLTTGATLIRQRTDYFYWIFAALLDFFGISALTEGRPGAFLRRLIDGGLMYWFVTSHTLFGYIMAAIFAFFTIAPFFFTLMAIFNPETLVKKGVHIPQNLVKLLNFFEAWTGVIGKNATAVVRQDFGLAAVDPTTAPQTFGYETVEKLTAEQDAAAAASTSSKQKQIMSWPISMLLGNVFGGLLLGIVNLFSWIPTVKMGLLAADGFFATVRVSRGQTPDAPDISSFLPPGVGAVAGTVGSALTKGVGNTVAKKLEGITTAVRATQALTSAPEELLNKATVAVNPAAALDKLKGSISLDPVHNASNLEEDDAGDPTSTQRGGARATSSSLSTESLVLGTTVIALIAGGAIKMAVDSLSDN